jgi:aspartyl-tRNA(Asn)/glutamyl-tRNA(Gln) amidotransferase subunit A
MPTTYRATRAALDRGELTTQTVVQTFLDRIQETTHLNIYVDVYGQEALQAAIEQDRRRAAGEPLGKLAGMVVSIKDVICYRNHGVSAGSRMLENFTSLFSATAVERLLAEDAIIIGRTNCDEFAMGSANEHSYYGPTRNAADPRRVPGGSSGGAAVAVQAQTCHVALGSDTGGSVRQPAGFCGVIGLKPTYGRISRHGLLAYGSSFDQIGLLGHDAGDLALVLELIAGPDEYDSTAAAEPVGPYPLSGEAPRRRIAYWPAALEHPSLDPVIRAQYEEQLDAWRAAGHTVAAAEFDLLEYIVPAYYVLVTAEATSNLSRYDGLRYGYRSPEATNLEETYRLSRTEGFGTEVKRRIMLGNFVLSAGYYDAYYGRAQQVRRLLRDRLQTLLAEYDFLFLPVAPTVAWLIGEAGDDPVREYLSDIFTVSANLAGLPAISIPLTTHPENGMPIGYQLMGRAWYEGELLGFAGAPK